MYECPKHWQALKDAIELRGLTRFIAPGGQEAAKRFAASLKGDKSAANFEPLIGASTAIFNNALEAVGIALMRGRQCPLCATGNEHWIDCAADEQLAKARNLGLMPPPS